MFSQQGSVDAWLSQTRNLPTTNDGKTAAGGVLSLVVFGVATLAILNGIHILAAVAWGVLSLIPGLPLAWVVRRRLKRRRDAARAKAEEERRAMLDAQTERQLADAKASGAFEIVGRFGLCAFVGASGSLRARSVQRLRQAFAENGYSCNVGRSGARSLRG